METDKKILGHLGEGEIAKAVAELKHKDLIAVQGLLAVAVACTAIFSKDSQPPRLPVVESQPRIGLINETVAEGNSELQEQLQAIRTLSGRPNCQPQIVTVEDGKGNVLADTFCRTETGTIMVSRHEGDSPGKVINQELRGYIQKDDKGVAWAVVLAYPDGSPDDGVNPVMWNYLDTGESEYMFPDGMRVRFGSGQSPFQAMVEDILAADLGLGQALAVESAPTLAATVAKPPTPEPTATPDQAIEFGIPVITAENLYDDTTLVALIGDKTIAASELGDPAGNPQVGTVSTTLGMRGRAVKLFEVERGGSRILCLLIAVHQSGYRTDLSEVGGKVYKDVRFIRGAIGVVSGNTVLSLSNLYPTDVQMQNPYGYLNRSQVVDFFSPVIGSDYGSSGYYFDFDPYWKYSESKGWEGSDPGWDYHVRTRRSAAAIIMPGTHVEDLSGNDKQIGMWEAFDMDKSNNLPVPLAIVRVNPK